jgi:hypothetical protein
MDYEPIQENRLRREACLRDRTRYVSKKGKQRRTDKTSSGRKSRERRKVSYKRKREKEVDPTRYMQ